VSQSVQIAAQNLPSLSMEHLKVLVEKCWTSEVRWEPRIKWI